MKPSSRSVKTLVSSPELYSLACVLRLNPVLKVFYNLKQAAVYAITAGRLVLKPATVESGWTRPHLQLLFAGFARCGAPGPARHAPSQRGKQLCGGRLRVGALSEWFGGKPVALVDTLLYN